MSERASSLRLLAARLDGNDTAYVLTLANFVDCQDCAVRVIGELVELLAHHIERSEHRAEWDSWLNRKLSALLDALSEASDDDHR